MLKKRFRPYKTYYSINSQQKVPRSTFYYKKRVININSKANEKGEPDDFQKDSFCAPSFDQSINTVSDNADPRISEKSIISKSCNANVQDIHTAAEYPKKSPTIPLSDDKKRNKLLSGKLCDCTNVSVGEVLLIIMSIMKKHCLTWVAVIDIFVVLNFIFKVDMFPTTKYMIKKLMKVNANVVINHIICSECKKYFGSSSKSIPNLPCDCSNNTVSSKPPLLSFFVEVDIKSQLQELFSNPVIRKSLDKRFHRQKQYENNLEDIYDGSHYQDCSSNILSSPWDLSYTFNTDGCQPSMKSTLSVWPIFLMIHEFPDEVRKKCMVLAGLWVSKVEPSMNIFLQPFANEADNLSSAGFTLFINNVNIKIRLFPLTCCLDSVARCAVLNMKRFNGIYGCTFCEHPTVNVNGVRKYPMMQNVPKRRTNESIKCQMIAAHTNKENTVGVWGPSCLINLKHFNMVNGMIVDFMHSALLGVAELYTNIIMSNTKAKYYVGSPAATYIINKRLLSIRPPTCIGKVPRNIQERNNWKASEWLFWLLYYAVPCLNGLPPRKYINHLAMFVTAMNILLRDSISFDDLETARQLLVKFVFYFGKYFGDEYMHYNVHFLLHICNTVRNWGPLWCINTFPFENQNKNLLRMKKGNCNVAKEIVMKLATYQAIYQLETEKFITQSSIDFCNQLRSNHLQKALKIKDCVLLGVGKTKELCDEEILSISDNIDINKITECKKYDKILYGNVRYTTCGFSNRKKTNDSVFETKGKKFGIITAINLINYENKYDVFVSFKLLCTSNISILRNEKLADIINLQRISLDSNDTHCIHYSQLRRPCIVTKCKSQHYISSLVKGSIASCIN